MNPEDAFRLLAEGKMRAPSSEFNEIFTIAWPYILKLCFSAAKTASPEMSAADQNDAIGEALKNITNSRQKYSGTAVRQLKGWLWTSIERSCWRTFGPRQVLKASGGNDVDLPFPDPPSPARETPETILQNKELHTIIYECLKSLPVMERKVFILKHDFFGYLADMNLIEEDVDEILALPRQRAHDYLKRAKELLGRCLLRKRGHDDLM